MGDTKLPRINPEAAADVEQLLQEDRYLEGAVRVLEKEFGAVPHWIDDALGRAVEKLVTRDPKKKPVKNPRAFVLTVARNDLIKAAAREPFPHEPDDPMWADHLPGTPLPDELLVQEDFYDWLRGRAEKWENARMRVVTLLFLEAAYDGEPLTLEDAAEAAAEILDEDISISTVFRWKERGLAQLANDWREHEEGVPENDD